MKTIPVAFVLALVAACAACKGTGGAKGAAESSPSQEEEKKMAPVAKPEPKNEPAFLAQVAGRFYPGSADALRTMVRDFIDDKAAKDAAAQQGIIGALSAKAGSLSERDVVGVLSPHAGYPYSGPFAGAAFRALEGRGYATVVVLALSHRKAARKVALLDRPAYETPLGPLPIDRASVAKLVANHPDLFAVDEGMFREEHSLEVQLPFVQVALPEAAIVPVIVAVDDRDVLKRAGEALFALLGKRSDVAFVVSSDLSHYHPYEQANALDEESLGPLEKLDLEKWRKAASRSAEGMCGVRPMELFLGAFAKFDGQKRSVVRLAHGNSGDTAGDKGSVVGYGALAFTVEKGMREEAKTSVEYGPYGPKERRALMELAKKTVEAAARGETFVAEAPESPVLAKDGAAFVTLKKNGDLRGCIGHVIARMPLYRCVSEVARAAAIHDTRFSPVKPEELSSLEFEISILTAPEPTTPDAVVVGRDGLIMSRGGRSGLLLPQVPVEWGWGREEFLAHTCRKAGLPLDCWKDPETRIESFRAIVFGESDLED